MKGPEQKKKNFFCQNISYNNNKRKCLPSILNTTQDSFHWVNRYYENLMGIIDLGGEVKE